MLSIKAAKKKKTRKNISKTTTVVPINLTDTQLDKYKYFLPKKDAFLKNKKPSLDRLLSTYSTYNMFLW